ncbi:MAG: hypothetical protein GX660_23400 [Clostridiaceae bacterium]|nr:hypothetical protein [Clostridiaceae bacterium]
MLKRIFAWVMLAGFVLLLINLCFRLFYWKESIVVYGVLAVLYFIIFLMKKDKIY